MTAITAPDPIVLFKAPTKPRKKVVKAAPPPAEKVWEEVTDKTATKLIGTIGIELTANPPGLLKEKDTDVAYKLADGYAAVVEALLIRKKYGVNKTHGDFNSVEVSSEVLTTWGQVKKFYDTVSGIMASVGCTPHSEHHVSGGGHIHVGGLSVVECISLMRSVQNRPWLAWVLNDPDDDRSANSYCEKLTDLTESTVRTREKFPEDSDDYATMREYREARDKWVAEGGKLKTGDEHSAITAAKGLNVDLFALLGSSSINGTAKTALTFYANPKYVNELWLPDEKCFYLRYYRRQKTLEFRFFQTPLNWDEQMAHLKFVEALITWVREKLKTGHEVVQVDTVKKLNAFTLEQCQTEFIKFLDELGLPHKPYARMLVENLPDRFKRGVRK